MDQPEQHIGQAHSMPFVILKSKYARKRKSLFKERPPTQRVSPSSGSSGTPTHRLSNPDSTRSSSYLVPQSTSSRRPVPIPEKRVRFSATNKYFLLSEFPASSTNSDLKEYVGISEKCKGPSPPLESGLLSLDESVKLKPSPSYGLGTGSSQINISVPASPRTREPVLNGRLLTQRAPTVSGSSSTVVSASRVSETTNPVQLVGCGSLNDSEPGMASLHFSKLGFGGLAIQSSTETKFVGIGRGVAEGGMEEVESGTTLSVDISLMNPGYTECTNAGDLSSKSIPLKPTHSFPVIKTNVVENGTTLLKGRPLPRHVSTESGSTCTPTHPVSNQKSGLRSSDALSRGPSSHGYPLPIPGRDFGVSKTGEQFPLLSSPFPSLDSDSDEELSILEKYRLPNVDSPPHAPGTSSGHSSGKRAPELPLGPKMASRLEDDEGPFGGYSPIALEGKKTSRMDLDPDFMATNPDTSI